MKSYDLVCIFRPDLEPDQLKAAVDRLSGRITEQGGTLESVDIWGKKRMAFAIKRLREGMHVHVRFTFDPQQVNELRRSMALVEEVLRVVITNAVGKVPEPAVAAASAPPAPAAEVQEGTAEA